MVTISGRTKLLGLVGKPIGHSLSPRIHNVSAELLGLDQVYLPFELDLSGLDDARSFLDWAWKLGVVGLNVTLPYKNLFAEAIAHPLASINTLYRTDAAWAGASSDGIGFQKAVEGLSPNSTFEQLILLGNGGAALAIAQHYLKEKLCRQCHILRRSDAKDEAWQLALADHQDVSYHPFKAETLARLLESKGETLLVQASSAPLFGDNLQAFAEVLTPFSGVLVDIVYGQTSALLPAAVQLGIPCQDGLSMLIEQARASQLLWWGQSANFKNLESALAR